MQEISQPLRFMIFKGFNPTFKVLEPVWQNNPIHLYANSLIITRAPNTCMNLLSQIIELSYRCFGSYSKTESNPLKCRIIAFKYHHASGFGNKSSKVSYMLTRSCNILIYARNNLWRCTYISARLRLFSNMLVWYIVLFSRGLNGKICNLLLIVRISNIITESELWI